MLAENFLRSRSLYSVMFFWDIMADLSQLLHFAGVPRLAGATGTYFSLFFSISCGPSEFKQVEHLERPKRKKKLFHQQNTERASSVVNVDPDLTYPGV